MYDYSRMILKMLKRINDPIKLKKIYDYICFIYLNGGG